MLSNSHMQATCKVWPSSEEVCHLGPQTIPSSNDLRMRPSSGWVVYRLWPPEISLSIPRNSVYTFCQTKGYLPHIIPTPSQHMSVNTMFPWHRHAIFTGRSCRCPVSGSPLPGTFREGVRPSTRPSVYPSHCHTNIGLQDRIQLEDSRE